jgi:hypothetical protein
LQEVRLQAFAERVARDRHDTLVARGAVRGFDGDDDRPLAGERTETGLAVDRIVARHAAHLEVVRALRDEQTDEALALQLQRDRAVELERRREQHDGADRLAEQLLHGGRIVLVLAQFLPRAADAHRVTADGMPFEIETPNEIRLTHGAIGSISRRASS